MNPDSTTQLHYQTGEEVRIGDIVRYALEEDVVEAAFYPGTGLAEDFFCYDSGGALLKRSRVLVQPGTDLWEDVDFVRRGDDPRL